MRKLVLIVLLCTAANAQERLGTIVFPNSGKPEAQAAFLRGVLLMHNFAYPQAKRAFVEAQKIDPKFALAYWDEAMTYNHPIWNQVDVEAARRVLQDLAPLKSSVTPRERGYIAAVEALYGDGDKISAIKRTNARCSAWPPRILTTSKRRHSGLVPHRPAVVLRELFMRRAGVVRDLRVFSVLSVSSVVIGCGQSLRCASVVKSVRRS